VPVRDRLWHVGVAVLAVGLVASALAAEALASPARQSSLLWSGDYQTGNFKQWFRLQAVAGGATIVTSPAHDARYTARFRVRPGDNPIHSSGERAEARASQEQTGGHAGKEYWYAWSTLFPADAGLPPSAESWNIFTQWHQTERDGCPPNIAFQADTSHSPPAIKLRVRGGGLHDCRVKYDVVRRPAPLQLDRWYDFVVHIKWSSKPSVGFIETWIDGVKVLSKTRTATLYSGHGAYLKQGFYRAVSPLTTTVYHVGTRAAGSYRAIAPN
jgi:polysaccharide lyase-like protein